jgi:hypothetical protein
MKPINIAIASIIWTVFLLTCHAQEASRAPFKKGGIEFGGDYFRPSGSSSGLFSAAGAGYVAINFRPLRNLQIDAVQADFIAAHTDRQTQIVFDDGTVATRAIEGHPSLIAFGGRFVLPLFREKVLLSAGGGWSGVQVSEAIQTNPNEQGTCISCEFHRGWGPTEIAEVMFFPGDQRNVGFGFHVRGVQAITNGLSVSGSTVSGKDHFLLIGGSVSIRFK